MGMWGGGGGRGRGERGIVVSLLQALLHLAQVVVGQVLPFLQDLLGQQRHEDAHLKAQGVQT